jgi:hypothetical protein
MRYSLLAPSADLRWQLMIGLASVSRPVNQTIGQRAARFAHYRAANLLDSKQHGARASGAAENAIKGAIGPKD